MGGGSGKVEACESGFSERQLERVLTTYNQLFSKGKTVSSSFTSLFFTTQLPELPVILQTYCDSHVSVTKNPAQEFVNHMGYILNGRLREDRHSPLVRLKALLCLETGDLDPCPSLLHLLLQTCETDKEQDCFRLLETLGFQEMKLVLERDFPVLETCLISHLKALILATPIPRMTPVPTFGSIGPSVLHILRLSALDLFYSPVPELLFTSSEHGFSLLKIIQSSLGYSGVSVLLLRANLGQVLGVVIGEELKEKSEFYGTSSTFLFTFSPQFRTFRNDETCSEANFIYCNTKILRSEKYPAGLGFGGNQKDGFRLWLGMDLDQSYVMKACFTFEKGDVIPMEEGNIQTPLHISCIELWGFGGQSAQDSKAKADFDESARLRNLRKVDRAAFMEGGFNKEYLLSSTFSHRDQVREDP